MREFDILKTGFHECSALSTEMGIGAREVVDAIQEVGGRFLRFENAKPLVHLSPIDAMDKDGGFLVRLVFEHPLLAEPREQPVRTVHAIANLNYLRVPRKVAVWQIGDPDDLGALDPSAKGQLALARLLYPVLSPKLAFVDESGLNPPGAKKLKKTEIRYIFWANFYGPAYVEKFGRDLFLNAPGWKKEELDGGGLLYVVTENYVDWWQNPPEDVLTYFREHVPDVKLYRAKSRYE